MTRQEWMDMLSRTDLYLEWAIIVVALAVAWSLAEFIRRRGEAWLQAHPPARINPLFLSRPLLLLPSLLAMATLILAAPLVPGEDSGLWIKAAAQLCFAWLLAKSALLIIKLRLMGWFIAAIIMLNAVLSVTGLIMPVTAYLDSVAFAAGAFKLSLLDLMQGLVILIVVFWLAGVFSGMLENYLRHSVFLSYTARELSVKFFRIFVYFAAVMITLSVLGIDLTAFAIFGGALGVGIGLGLQKITANFVSGITMLMERSVRIGDLVEVGDTAGWIRQLNIRYTVMEAFDGREIMIPNEELMSSRVTNWTHSNNQARVDVEIGVAYGSDLRLVQKLILEAAAEHPKCLKDPEVKCWLREFADSSVNFLLVFWVADVREGRFGPKSDVMFAIFDKFRQHGVEIPFPQRVVTMKNG